MRQCLPPQSPRLRLPRTRPQPTVRQRTPRLPRWQRSVSRTPRGGKPCEASRDQQVRALRRPTFHTSPRHPSSQCSSLGKRSRRRHRRNIAPRLPSRHRPPSLAASPPTTASQDPGQPATVPPTATTVTASSIAEAITTGVRVSETFGQPRMPLIVRSDTAISSPPAPQTVPSPLATASTATQAASVPSATIPADFQMSSSADTAAEPPTAFFQTARSAIRAPGRQGTMTAAAPTQAGARPTAFENPMVAAAPAGPDTADGATIQPSAHPSSPIAIDAGIPAAPSTAPPTAAAIATPDDPSSTSRPASPAAQMAPVLVSLRHMADGTQRVTMRLDPPELGRVQVSIDRSPDALGARRRSPSRRPKP